MEIDLGGFLANGNVFFIWVDRSLTSRPFTISPTSPLEFQLPFAVVIVCFGDSEQAFFFVRS